MDLEQISDDGQSRREDSRAHPCAASTAAGVLEKGRRMQEHETQETVVIHVLSGDLHLDLPNGPMNLAPGQIVTIDKGARHAVEAYSDSAFLMTLGWPARAGD